MLSSPRVSTLHNQKAIIKAGTDEFFVTGIDSNTTTGEATTTTLDVELTPFFSGVALDVTPQISEDGSVLMHIHPTVSEVNDQSKRISFGESIERPAAGLQPDPRIRQRGARALRPGHRDRRPDARDPHSATTTRRRSSSDIPGVGGLFKSKRDVSSTVELVLLLRPVVANDDDWDAMVKEADARAAALAREGQVEGLR